MTGMKDLGVLLSRQQKRSALLLLCLMLMAMLLEMLGIGLVIPVLTLITQPGAMAQYPQLATAMAWVGNPTAKEMILMVLSLLVGVYAFKVVFIGFVTWRQARFVFGVQASLAQRLFSGYLQLPYSFHLQRNSAQLIQNVLSETNQFARGAMLPAMLLLTEAMVLFGICILLLVVEPLGALSIMIIMLFAGGLFYSMTRSRSRRWGQARQLHEGISLRHLQQGLGGLKEVKLLGCEDNFLAQFSGHMNRTAQIWQRQTTLQAIPRLWLELLAVCGLTALVGIFIWQGKPLDRLVPTMGLFAVAAFRLMPSFNRALTASQNLRFALPVISRLVEELRLFGHEQAYQHSGKLAYRHELLLQNVCFTYPGASTQVLNEISLRIPCGDCIGIIGGSGAGKSTLVDLVLGLHQPTRGSILADGVDIYSDTRGWMNQIGYVPQSIYLIDDTLRSNIAFGVPPEQVDEKSVLRALYAAQLEAFVGALPEGLDTVVGERGVRLSGGQRQRIGIARALYHDPSVLVLDEATSALDYETEQGVMEAVRALHGAKTIIIVAHRISTVMHCDTVVRLEQGAVVDAGAPSRVLAYQTGE